MSWIKVIPPQEASGKLKKLYRRVAGPNHQIDNILKVHSLRPGTLEGHMTLYKNALHHQANQLPKWQLETLGCYVSICNHCDYCLAHHFEGLRRLLGDTAQAELTLTALKTRTWRQVLDHKTALLLDYTHKLTQTPGTMVEADVALLRRAGFSDGEILEANQVIAYFAYANRTVLGLGVTTEGDLLGLSPGLDDPNNWNHQ